MSEAQPDPTREALERALGGTYRILRLLGRGGMGAAYLAREEAGLLCRGFARLRCEDCHENLLVAFSCRGPGFCPSCVGRRRRRHTFYAERAANEPKDADSRASMRATVARCAIACIGKPPARRARQV